MRALSRSVRGVVQPLMTQGKALWAEICLDWPAFVGELAHTTRPSALRFTNPRTPGVLWVEVWEQDAFAMTYEAPAIIQAVNRYAGRQVVQTVKYAVVPPPPKKKNMNAIPVVTAHHQTHAHKMVTGIGCQNSRLAEALTSFGAHILAQKKF